MWGWEAGADREKTEGLKSENQLHVAYSPESDRRGLGLLPLGPFVRTGKHGVMNVT